METRAEYVLVGGFVVALLAGLALAVLWFAQAQFKANAVRYDIYFEGSVSGLATGSNVRYNGVPVGTVSDIRLDPQHPTRVRVTVDIRPDVVIRTDTVAQLQVEGLTGVAYVQITGASGDAPLLKAEAGQPYPVIASKPSQLEQLFSGLPDLIQKLSNLADQLNGIASDKNRVALTQTLDNLRQVSDVAAAHKQDIGAMLRDASGTMSRLDQLIAQAQALVAELTRLADSFERDPTRLIYGDQQKGYRPK